MGDNEEDDFHFFGTPIENEVEIHTLQRRKEIKDPGATRALPIWKQEPTDAQGRRRFHGAFTGGYSAGYFNTAGSAEGWAPSSFHSSRSRRATETRQSAEQFMDEDELEDLRRTNLQTTTEYDTFGDAAAEGARRHAAILSRPAPIPGLLPDELIVPVASSIGVKLLQRMGWRQGKGIGAATGAHGIRQIENTPLHLIHPKADSHGLGYDPFQGAEEFRAEKTKRRRVDAARPQRAMHAVFKEIGGKKTQQPRTRGIAFGSGVAMDDDEDDAYGVLEDYVSIDDVASYEETAGVDGEGMPVGRVPVIERAGLGDRLALQGYAFEIQEGEEEKEGFGWGDKNLSITGGGWDPAGTVPPALLLHNTGHAEQSSKRTGFIPGFVCAERSNGIQKPIFFPPPRVPKDYVPMHGPWRQTHQGQQQPSPPPPRFPPPTDAQLRQEIDRVAFFIARNGPEYERIAREEQVREGRRAFLMVGGEGSAYFAWKVHALRALIQTPHTSDASKGGGRRGGGVIGQRSAPLTAEERGIILGEEQLEQQQQQQAETPHPRSTAPKAMPIPHAAAETKTTEIDRRSDAQEKHKATLARSLLNVAAEDRQRLQALLGSTFVKASSQEHEDGAVVEQKALQSARRDTPRVVTAQDLSRPGACAQNKDAAQAHKTREAALQGIPLRYTEEWRPDPLLCKRLDLPDPYKGRPREIHSTMSKFRTDYLALPATAEAEARGAERTTTQSVVPRPGVRGTAQGGDIAASTKTPPQLALAPPPPTTTHPATVDGTSPAGDTHKDMHDEEHAAAAVEFLSSMFGGKPDTDRLDTLPQTEQALFEEPAMFPEAVIEKPIELFKAIFNASSSESSGDKDEPEEEGEEGTGRDGDQTVHHATENTIDFGFAKFRGLGGDVVGPRRTDDTMAPAAAPAVNPDVQKRIEAALKVLKAAKHKKHDRKRGERKEKKLKHGKKEKKERKRHRRSGGASE